MKTTGLIETALSLPLEERVILIDSLIESLNHIDADSAREWKLVANRRLKELEESVVKGRSAEDVVRVIRASVK